MEDKPHSQPSLPPGTLVSIHDGGKLMGEEYVVGEEGYLWTIVEEILRDDGLFSEPDDLKWPYKYVRFYKCKSLATGHEHEWYDEEFRYAGSPEEEPDDAKT